MAVPLATRIRDGLREVVLEFRRQYLTRVWKMTSGKAPRFPLSAKLDKTNPQGIHIGTSSVVTFGAAILVEHHVETTHGASAFHERSSCSRRCSE